MRCLVAWPDRSGKYRHVLDDPGAIYLKLDAKASVDPGVDRRLGKLEFGSGNELDSAVLSRESRGHHQHYKSECEVDVGSHFWSSVAQDKYASVCYFYPF